VGRSEAPTQAESLTAANELMAKGTQKLNDSMTAPTPDIARKLLNQAGDYHEAAAYELTVIKPSADGLPRNSKPSSWTAVQNPLLVQ